MLDRNSNMKILPKKEIIIIINIQFPCLLSIYSLHEIRSGSRAKSITGLFHHHNRHPIAQCNVAGLIEAVEACPSGSILNRETD